jgi:hypothetical protein
MQRIVDDHTSYIIRVRTKCKIDEESLDTGLPANQGDFTNSYTIPEHGGLQGTDRAIITCHLTLNHGVPSYPKVPMHPSTTPVYKETTYTPSGP